MSATENRENFVRALTRLCDDELPSKAQASPGDYPVHLDHCFRRIAYDNALCTKWDTAVDRPFIDNADVTDLALAVGVARSMYRGGPATVRRLNEFSLSYRDAE